MEYVRIVGMRATARAQPNIALVKYWGKRDSGLNLPAVGSISITLESLFTEMRVSFDSGLNRGRLSLDGDESAARLPRPASSNRLPIPPSVDRDLPSRRC